MRTTFSEVFSDGERERQIDEDGRRASEVAELRKDAERLDWLEETKHVICFDDGEWFCAWRGGPDGWVDRPMADNIRQAIDTAMEDGK